MPQTFGTAIVPSLPADACASDLAQSVCTAWSTPARSRTVTAQLQPTDATTLGRKPERGDYRVATINAILDEALVAHVGFSVDGQPFVLPMVYGRDGDRLFLHGSVANRMLRTLDAGARVCVTVTLVDELVVSRSHFHMSMNYRSVVIVGTARRLRDPEARAHALACVVDHVVPGRAAEARPPTDAELKQTMVLELTIDEASAKQRVGPAIEEPDDLGLDIWGGVMPVTTSFGPPEPDGQGTPTRVPDSVGGYSRP
jgi:nitroimidazol reductase NimA-like FMN-containing flavoprotein (pyridoxamine 5'-phosphate oxidase superfamily)